MRGLSEAVWAMGVRVGAVGAGIVALMALVGCGASIGDVQSLDPNDYLYANVQAECGPDALVLRAVDQGAEAICCVTYSRSIVPSLHCLRGDGERVSNPASLSRLRYR